MNCTTLASKIEHIQPEASASDVARLCLLIASGVEDTEQLSDDNQLRSIWHDIGLKLQIATDQHAAMTQELEDLASGDPKQFSPEQIWVLIRAIKVQSQVLQLYVNDAVIDV